MCLSKIKNWFLERKIKREFSKIEVDPKGICISIYCAKIVANVLTKEDIIVPYEKELYTYFLISNEIKNNRVWTAEERIITAASYLTFTFNCSNGAYVQQRVLEELSEYS